MSTTPDLMRRYWVNLGSWVPRGYRREDAPLNRKLVPVRKALLALAKGKDFTISSDIFGQFRSITYDLNQARSIAKSARDIILENGFEPNEVKIVTQPACLKCRELATFRDKFCSLVGLHLSLQERYQLTKVSRTVNRNETHQPTLADTINDCEVPVTFNDKPTPRANQRVSYVGKKYFYGMTCDQAVVVFTDHMKYLAKLLGIPFQVFWSQVRSLLKRIAEVLDSIEVHGDAFSDADRIVMTDMVIALPIFKFLETIE